MIYRNFEIGAEKLVRVPPHLQGTWRAWMRELPDGSRIAISIISDTESEAIECARQCVDYDYRVKVWEFLNGRKYNAIDDGNIPAFEEPK